jgi:RNA polymerase sigma-70 factor (ECF subfamily)
MKIDSHIREHELLLAITQGNEEAFRNLFLMFRDKIYAYSFHFTRSDFIAEEITQEVFMKIWTNRALLSRIDSIEAWMITVTRNLCFNHLKKKALEQKIKNSVANQPAKVEENIDNYLSYKEQVNRIGRAIEQLSPRQRLIFRLNRDEGMKNEEIARQLKISPNTVKAHMVTALSKIRHFLETHPANIVIFLLFWK